MSASLLLRGAERVVTQNIAREERAGADVLVEGDEIRAIGEGLTPPEGCEVLDCRGCVVLPGLINGHHHLFQTLTRALPGAQDQALFDWLGYHYPIWAHHDGDSVEAAARVGLAELLLTGCTATADHHYLFPREAEPDILDRTIRAARDLGIRFHPTRGSISRGLDAGGIAPESLCQDEATILEDCERVRASYHDASPRSMTRIGVGPCAPFSVSPELMRESAAWARRHGLRLHTHLAETRDEEEYCLRVYQKRPFEFMEEVDWVGADVWYAHGIHFDDAEIERLGEEGTGVCHCPGSNMRLGSGTAPVGAFLAHSIPVGLGVDGSASNDSSDLLGEVRNCLLTHRQASGVEAMNARQALRLATWGGARILGRTDQLGSVEVGKAADLAVFRVDGLGMVGTGRDPVAGLVFSGFEHRAWATIVGGRVVVREGRLTSADEAELAASGREQAELLLGRAGLL